MLKRIVAGGIAVAAIAARIDIDGSFQTGRVDDDRCRSRQAQSLGIVGSVDEDIVRAGLDELIVRSGVDAVLVGVDQFHCVHIDDLRAGAIVEVRVGTITAHTLSISLSDSIFDAQRLALEVPNRTCSPGHPPRFRAAWKRQFHLVRFLKSRAIITSSLGLDTVAVCVHDCCLAVGHHFLGDEE